MTTYKKLQSVSVEKMASIFMLLSVPCDFCAKTEGQCDNKCYEGIIQGLTEEYEETP